MIKLLQKKEMFNLKRIFNLLSKVSAGILTLVIVSFANSSGCYLFYQPKAPKSMDDFKILK